MPGSTVRSSVSAKISPPVVERDRPPMRRRPAVTGAPGSVSAAKSSTTSPRSSASGFPADQHPDADRQLRAARKPVTASSGPWAAPFRSVKSGARSISTFPAAGDPKCPDQSGDRRLLTGTNALAPPPRLPLARWWCTITAVRSPRWPATAPPPCGGDRVHGRRLLTVRTHLTLELVPDHRVPMRARAAAGPERHRPPGPARSCTRPAR